MIAETDHRAPSLARLTRKTLTTGLGALENRAELFMVEVEEEEARLIKLIVFGMGALFLALMTMMLLTGTILFIVPEEHRLWAALGFTVLYLGGTIAAIFALKAQLKRIPFAESLRQIRKDRELLDVFK
jgi:uncharacterized membrane protein YqjE